MSPLKALSNDIHQQSRGAAGRHPGAAAPERACRCRHPHLGQNGRHARRRARADAPPPAAHSGDDAGIALRSARLAVRARDAGERPLGDRRRNPRGRAEQARRPSRFVAGEARGFVRRPPAAHRPLGHAEPDRSRRPFPRRRCGGRQAGRGGRDHRRGTSAPARFEPRDSRIAARGGDVERGVDGSLRAPDRAHRGAPHDARVRQHAAHGRTRRARAQRPSRQRGRHRASRQHGEGAQALRRTEAEARRTESAGGDRLARARHRYRRRQSRLSDRFAALDRDLPAARRPLRPRDRRHAQGAPVSALARRSGRVRSASRQRASRRA